MMSRILSHMTIAILSVCLLVIFPAFKICSTADDIKMNIVSSAVDNFQDTVRKKGYVSKESYENFIKRLAVTDYLYNVELLHEKQVYYPLKKSDKDYTIEKPWTVHYEKFNNNQILDCIYNASNSKDYRMSVGDDFYVIVTNKSITKTRIFMNYVGGSAHNIFVQSGGMVSNEAY